MPRYMIEANTKGKLRYAYCGGKTIPIVFVDVKQAATVFTSKALALGWIEKAKAMDRTSNTTYTLITV